MSYIIETRKIKIEYENEVVDVQVVEINKPDITLLELNDICDQFGSGVLFDFKLINKIDFDKLKEYRRLFLIIQE